MIYEGDDGVDYEWVQTISTNDPKDSRVSSPYVDPAIPDDELPFYYTRMEDYKSIVGNFLYFKDKPSRRGEDSNWKAELSVVKYVEKRERLLGAIII